MDDVEEGLLRAIRDAPDDDHPRLVYADWLAPRDPARAELIAVSCELARDPARADLAARRDELLALPELAWWQDAVRGFWDEDTLRVTAADWIADPDAHFRQAPLATSLSLANPHGRFAELAAQPALARYRGLHLYATSRRADTPQITDEDHALLAASPHLGGLEDLELVHGELRDGGLRAILASAAFALRRLSIAGNAQLTERGLGALEQARHPIEHLDVSQLPGKHFGLTSLFLLFRHDTLRSVAAKRCGLDAQREIVVRALAARSRLEELDLSHNNLSPGHLAALAAGRKSLVRIRIAHNPLRDDGLIALADAAFTHLAHLDVSACGLTPRGIAHLLAHLPRSLVALQLAHGDVGDALDALPRSAHLEDLRLGGCELDEASATRFVHSAAAEALHTLDLAGVTFGDAFAEALVASPHLGALRRLVLDARGLGEPTVARVQRRFPGVDLSRAGAFAL